MKKYATLKDIALKLNLSTATVSRALADRWDVSQETKKLVKEEANRQNYKPNINAKRLQNRKSKTIGLVVPEFRTTFFPNIITGIQKVVDEHGYQLLITQSNESMEVERRNLQLLEDNMVEGIILSITQEGENIKEYQQLMDSGIPLVFFNRVCTKTAAPKVMIDDYKSAFFATEHLIYNGFKKIIHFGGPINLNVAKERKRGFLDAIKKHKLEIAEDTVLTANVLGDKGYLLMQSLIDTGQLPEAIFCFNDPTAVGALKAIQEAGLNCPDDIALVGFSESELAQLINPTLTSVAVPTFKMGETAATLLFEQLESENQAINRTVILSAQLNIRKSSRNTRSK